jgi:hypothetical protein
MAISKNFIDMRKHVTVTKPVVDVCSVRFKM